MPGEHLDLSSDGPARGGDPTRGAESSTPAGGRKFVGVQFTCCDIYTRVYINREETAYEGHCPRCGKKTHLGIGPGGTDSRFFTAG